jgi:lysophospholipase L1-like esterase
LKKDRADDGLHPNAAGFKIMAPMAEAAIEEALQ